MLAVPAFRFCAHPGCFDAGREPPLCTFVMPVLSEQSLGLTAHCGLMHARRPLVIRFWLGPRSSRAQSKLQLMPKNTLFYTEL